VNGWLILAVVVVLLFGLYVSQVVGRLDRLHRRIDTARLGLEVQLARRSGLVTEVAGSGLVDPATALVLADAAAVAREAPPEDADVVSIAESDLTRALSAAFADREDVDAVEEESGGVEMVQDLETACRRVQLARRFHNDAVRACLVLRRRRLVRALQLAGHTPLPATVELDDSLPAGFGGR
jgi:hypothetical protein